MNRVCGRFLLLLCCFFLFLCISGVSGDTFEELEGRGLVIRSSPPGTDVYIDGIKRGTTPLTLESLPTGSYTVRLSRDGYEERRFKVTIRELSRIEVSIDLERMTGQLHISAVQAPGSPPPERLPFEPEIFAEGEQVYGSFVSLPTGFRTITVRAFGWEEVSREVYINRDSFESLEITMVPAAYDIRNVSSGRTRFNPVNPGNLGISEINFGVSAPGEGDITIRDASGSVVFAKTLEPFTGWRQSVRWNGRTAEGNAVPDGEYLVHIDTRSIPWDDSAPLRREAELSLVIDSSIQIYPVSLSAGTPGLLFSPMPEILPAGSFQFDGTMMFGKAPLSDKAWKSLPFSGAFRFSFLELFEIGTAVNISPVFGGDAFVGAGGAFKWAFMKASDSRPLGMALSLSYGWNMDAALSPFALNSGAGISLPLSLRIMSRLRLSAAPALLWSGKEGYPSEAAPRLLLSGGLAYNYSFISAGLSLRSEYNFKRNDFGPLIAGAELRLFPPPSFLVFTLSAGAWHFDSQGGFFGGIGIGFIN